MCMTSFASRQLPAENFKRSRCNVRVKRVCLCVRERERERAVEDDILKLRKVELLFQKLKPQNMGKQFREKLT